MRKDEARPNFPMCNEVRYPNPMLSGGKIMLSFHEASMFEQSKVKITTYQAELEWERRLHDSRLTFASCFATVLSHFNIATFM